MTRVAALAIGLTLGVGTTAGAALLLYTERGFLATAGFLVSVTIIAVAAGVWVGHSDEQRLVSGPATRRWIWVVTAFGAAGAMAWAWGIRDDLRTSTVGGAIAVLLILAEPAYTTGSLAAALNVHARRSRQSGSAVAVPVLTGLGAGVILAASVLIPNTAAQTLYFGAAAFLALIGMIEVRRPAHYGKDTRSMDGTVVIITGVSDAGQAGFEIARRLLDAGARIAITGSRAEVHERVRDLSVRGDCVGVQADLLDPVQASRVVDAARDRYGRLDALINAAGGLRVIKPIAQTTETEWRNEIQRNADTALIMSQAALPLLRQFGGAIVNFAAPAGFRAVRNLGAYSAGKASVIALTRALALEENANGVRVNAIAPGLIDTAQNRADVHDPETTGWVRREEIADVVLFLVSDASSGISGETVHVLGHSLK